MAYCDRRRKVGRYITRTSYRSIVFFSRDVTQTAAAGMCDSLWR